MEEGCGRKEGGGGRRYKGNFYGIMERGDVGFILGRIGLCRRKKEEEKYLRRGTTQG